MSMTNLSNPENLRHYYIHIPVVILHLSHKFLVGRRYMSLWFGIILPVFLSLQLAMEQLPQLTLLEKSSLLMASWSLPYVFYNFFCLSTTPLVYSINRILYVGLQIVSCKNKSDLILQKNYLEVYCYDSWGASTIPNFEVGQQVSYPVPELVACLLVVNSASCGAVFLHLQR